MCKSKAYFELASDTFQKHKLYEAHFFGFPVFQKQNYKHRDKKGEDAWFQDMITD